MKQFIFIFSDSLKVGQTNWPHSFFVSCSIKNFKKWTTTTTTYSPSTSGRPCACRVWGEGKTRWVMSLLSLLCLLPAIAGVCGWQTLLLLGSDLHRGNSDILLACEGRGKHSCACLLFSRSPLEGQPKGGARGHTGLLSNSVVSNREAGK